MITNLLARTSPKLGLLALYLLQTGFESKKLVLTICCLSPKLQVRLPHLSIIRVHVANNHNFLKAASITCSDKDPRASSTERRILRFMETKSSLKPKMSQWIRR